MGFQEVPISARVASVVLIAIGCTAARPPSSEDVARTRNEILASNALVSNALVSNALVSNALVSNALVSNALVSNALVSNALVSNALVSNALRPDGLTEGKLARDLLSYMYSCAMPVGVSMDLTIAGTSYGTLSGAVGLAPEWGQPGGSCGPSCRRWITACVLARTNFWGVPVMLSLRGPHPALRPSDSEKAEYPLREGAYFGDLFAGGTGGLSACAGPGSNVPQLTRRFCSGASGACVFTVPFECDNPSGAPLTPPTDPTRRNDEVRRACEKLDPSEGTALSCWTGGVSVYGDQKDGTRFQEVITVYLKQPGAMCGDGVCTGDETAATCRDCSTGWARRIGGTLSDIPGGMGVYPNGDVGVFVATDGSVDMGGGLLKGLPGDTAMVLARLGRDGRHIWSRTIAWGARGSLGIPGQGSADLPLFELPRQYMVVDGTGNAYLLIMMQGDAWFDDTRLPLIPLPGADTVYNAALVKVSPAGGILWAHNFLGGGWRLALAADGAPLVAAVMLDGGAPKFVLWRFTADGVLESQKDLPFALPLEIAGDGSVIQLARSRDEAFIRHFPETGVTQSFLYPGQGFFELDAKGGGVATLSDGGVVAFARVDLKATLLRYDAGGTLSWQKTVGDSVDGGGDLRPWDVKVNGRGEILAFARFTTPVDVEGQRFDPLSFFPGGVIYGDMMIGRYETNGGKRWARQLGGAGEDWLITAALSDDGIAYAVGGFGQSAVVDGWILANPFGGGSNATADSFVAALPDPPVTP